MKQRLKAILLNTILLVLSGLMTSISKSENLETSVAILAQSLTRELDTIQKMSDPLVKELENQLFNEKGEAPKTWIPNLKGAALVVPVKEGDSLFAFVARDNLTTEKLNLFLSTKYKNINLPLLSFSTLDLEKDLIQGESVYLLSYPKDGKLVILVLDLQILNNVLQPQMVFYDKIWVLDENFKILGAPEPSLLGQSLQINAFLDSIKKNKSSYGQWTGLIDGKNWSGYYHRLLPFNLILVAQIKSISFWKNYQYELLIVVSGLFLFLGLYFLIKLIGQLRKKEISQPVEFNWGYLDQKISQKNQWIKTFKKQKLNSQNYFLFEFIEKESVENLKKIKESWKSEITENNKIKDDKKLYSMEILKKQMTEVFGCEIYMPNTEFNFDLFEFSESVFKSFFINLNKFFELRDPVLEINDIKIKIQNYDSLRFRLNFEINLKSELQNKDFAWLQWILPQSWGTHLLNGSLINNNQTFYFNIWTTKVKQESKTKSKEEMSFATNEKNISDIDTLAAKEEKKNNLLKDLKNHELKGEFLLSDEMVNRAIHAVENLPEENEKTLILDESETQQINNKVKMVESVLNQYRIDPPKINIEIKKTRLLDVETRIRKPGEH